MRRFACLRGSSDDDNPDRCRSTQSTPRMQRYKVRDVSHDSQRSCNSITSMDAHRIHRARESSSDRERDRIKFLNRSWDAVENERVHCDHHRERTPPRGLDRAWETERTRGFELMYRSLEKEKERRSHKDKDRIRDRHSEKGRDKHGKRDKTEVTKEYLERRVEELTRQLQEEKQHSRKDKLTVAKLQRELARNKSEGPVRESLMRELERERMLRVDAENRLKEITIENDACKSRLQALQEDFKKMDEMVRGLMQYKNKLDQLKQEKSKLTGTYENTIEKYKAHLGNLEQDNQLLLAEVKKIESQDNGNVEDKERMKVLMQRLKQLEAENSALVLESEQQRGQYDKCLDEIANQVVQALLSQKSLREECMKLQKRVLDLETHNQQLAQMFQNRFQFSSDSLLQTYMHRNIGGMNSGDRSPHNTRGSSNSLPVRTQKSGTSKGPDDRTRNADESFDSLQSICSDYDDRFLYEDNLGRPEMSSPPAWLRDRIFSSGTPNSSMSKQDDSTSPTDLKINTLFPATNSSPKVTHIAQSRHEASAFELVKPMDNVNKNTKSQGKTLVSHTEYNQDHVKEEALSEIAGAVSKDTNNSTDARTQAKGTSWMKPEKPTYLSPHVKKDLDIQSDAQNKELDISPGKELLKLSDSFDEKYMLSESDGLPCIKRKHFILDSSSEDEEAKSRPVSGMTDVGSTISLNDLLEKELKDVITPTDEHDEYADDFLSQAQKHVSSLNRNHSENQKNHRPSTKKSNADSNLLDKEQSHSLPSIANSSNKAVNDLEGDRVPPITGSGDMGHVFGLLRSGSGYNSFPMLDQCNEQINLSLLSNTQKKTGKATGDKNVEVTETDSERSTSTVSQRSTLSPDSMHQSFTSSGSSDHVLGDKPHRDDGYSSMSMSSSDTHLSTNDKSKLKMPSVEESNPVCIDTCETEQNKHMPPCNVKERHPKRLFCVSLSRSNSLMDSLHTSPDKTFATVKNLHAFFEGKAMSNKLSGSRSSSNSKDVLNNGERDYRGLNRTDGAENSDMLLNCDSSHDNNSSKHSTIVRKQDNISCKDEMCLLNILSKNRLRRKCYKVSLENSGLRRTLSDSDIKQFNALTEDEPVRTLSLSCELFPECDSHVHSEAISPVSTGTDHSTDESIPNGGEGKDTQFETQRLNMVNEEKIEHHQEILDKPLQTMNCCNTPKPHRDYVNLSWLRNGEETSVHVCDNIQDQSVTCINCNQDDTNNMPDTQGEDPNHLYNGNTSTKLPKASNGKVFTNGTYIYQKGGKNSLPRHSEGHFYNSSMNNSEVNQLSLRSKPRNKFLDSVRTAERMSNRFSNSSIDSQASFETLSDTCCEEYATNSEDD